MLPQHATLLFARMAHVVVGLASIEAALTLPASAATVVGVRLADDVPLPSWPLPLAPQQRGRCPRR